MGGRAARRDTESAAPKEVRSAADDRRQEAARLQADVGRLEAEEKEQAVGTHNYPNCTAAAGLTGNQGKTGVRLKKHTLLTVLLTRASPVPTSVSTDTRVQCSGTGMHCVR